MKLPNIKIIIFGFTVVLASTIEITTLTRTISSIRTMFDTDFSYTTKTKVTSIVADVVTTDPRTITNYVQITEYSVHVTDVTTTQISHIYTKRYRTVGYVYPLIQ
eukprot:GHVP01024494.1.p1 GENE.GHVP01024494.1~~GHVP01024494.1.p1  ORF type:complete len:105 (-),score=6.33 GHVP01024494.1:120-434(-)